MDLSGLVAGPYCTRLLAGLGAEVIKVEEPGEGDAARRLAPLSPLGDPLECGAFFHHLNAGKKSITLNLQAQEGKHLLEALSREAHIVVESFAPGTLASLGLGYDSLSRENPRLVLTSISSFGQDGPYRDYQSADLVALALGGLLYTCGEPGREPLAIAGMQSAYLAGVNAAVGTLGALLRSEASGVGMWIDVSVQEAVASALEATTAMYSHDGIVRQRQGNRHGRTYPAGILPCKDGYVGVMIATDGDWALFSRLVGEERLADHRLDHGEDRVDHADKIEGIVQRFLIDRTRQEIFDWAQEVRLPFSMVLTPEEALSDPQNRARDFFSLSDHPSAGEVLQVGAPFKMHETPWRVVRAPLLGEHTEQVLRDRLNLSKEEIWQLRREGVV